MTQFTVEGTPLPEDWTPPKKRPEKIVRKYVFTGRTPNLIDQMALVTDLSKTEVVAASVQIAAMICKMSKTLFESMAEDHSSLKMNDVIGAVMSVYKRL